jgi:hypothetical protein
MRPPPTDDPTVRESFAELRYILRWLDERGKPGDPPRAILVGGWAVYAYNPYQGSYDIDLITNSKTRGSLMHQLTSERGFEKEPDPFSGRKGVVLRPALGRPIRIDFAYMSMEDTFEGTPDKMPMGFVVDHSSVEDMGGLRVPLPSRMMLIILKTKAAWDRRWRLEQGRSREPALEREKLAKDGADIMAIADSLKDSRVVEIGLLSEAMERYPFLIDILAKIGNDKREVETYGKDPVLARERIKRMLELATEGT